MKTFRFTIVETKESKDFKLSFCPEKLIAPLQKLVPKSKEDLDELVKLVNQGSESVRNYFSTRINFEDFKYVQNYVDVSDDCMVSMFKYCLRESDINYDILINYLKYNKSCIEISPKFLSDLDRDIKEFRGIDLTTSLEAIEFLNQNVNKHFSVETIDTEIVYKKDFGNFLEDCLRTEFFNSFDIFDDEDRYRFNDILEEVCDKEIKDLTFYYFNNSVENDYITIYGSYNFYDSEKNLIASSIVSQDRSDRVSLYEFENDGFQKYKYILQKAIDKFKDYLKNKIDEKYLLN